MGGGRQGRRARVLLVAVLAVGSLGAACLTPDTAGAQALRVSLYGDSVMLGARDQLLAQLAPWQPTVDAVESRSLLGTVSVLQSAGGTLGDVVVLDLGYNDMADPAVFRERIDAAMGVLRGVRHVICLDQRDWAPGRAAMNAELVAAAGRYPNLEVVDWNAEVAAHPDDVYGDGIHLTPAGQVAMAAIVRGRVQAYVDSLTPTTTSTTTTTTTRPRASCDRPGAHGTSRPPARRCPRHATRTRTRSRPPAGSGVSAAARAASRS